MMMMMHWTNSAKKLPFHIHNFAFFFDVLTGLFTFPQNLHDFSF